MVGNTSRYLKFGFDEVAVTPSGSRILLFEKLRSTKPLRSTTPAYSPGWQTKWRICYDPLVALRACKVSCRDIEGIEHSVRVNAESLYEAVARGLAAFRNGNWAGVLGTGLTRITVDLTMRRGPFDIRIWVRQAKPGKGGWNNLKLFSRTQRGVHPEWNTLDSILLV